MLRISVPRSVLILHPLLLFTIMCGSRLAYRAWKARLPSAHTRRAAKPCSCSAERTPLNTPDARSSSRSPKWSVVGMLDDNVGHHGRRLHGISVLGPLEKLEYWAERLSVERAIIAMPEATHRERRRAVELCRAARVEALTVPSFDDLVSGRVTVSEIRNVELDDLLGRDPVVLDNAGLRAGSPIASSWSPAPAARSAPSSAGKSPATNRVHHPVRAQRVRSLLDRTGVQGPAARRRRA